MKNKIKVNTASMHENRKALPVGFPKRERLARKDLKPICHFAYPTCFVSFGRLFYVLILCLLLQEKQKREHEISLSIHTTRKPFLFSLSTCWKPFVLAIIRKAQVF